MLYIPVYSHCFEEKARFLNFERKNTRDKHQLSIGKLEMAFFDAYEHVHSLVKHLSFLVLNDQSRGLMDAR